MAQHSWSDLWDRQAEFIEHYRKRMETYMKLTGIVYNYEADFDKAAADTSSPWLPPAPVSDTEASETRGALDVRDFGAVADTLTERGKNYGDFTDNADYAQRIKQAFYESKNWQTMPTYMQEALDLIASKLGRLLSGNIYHVDGWHDIQGYAKLIEERIIKRSK